MFIENKTTSKQSRYELETGDHMTLIVESEVNIVKRSEVCNKSFIFMYVVHKCQNLYLTTNKIINISDTPTFKVEKAGDSKLLENTTRDVICIIIFVVRSMCGTGIPR